MENVAICRRCSLKVEAEPFDSIFRLNCDECAEYRTERARLNWIGEKKALRLTCLYCWKSFRFERPLETHQCPCKVVHQCSECGQHLYSKEDLRKHAKYLHKKDAVTESEQCKELGMDSTQWSVGVNVQPGPSGIKVDDGKETKESSKECKFCTRKFSDVGSFRTHTCTYTEGIAHQCDVCLKTFSKFSSLRNHIPAHTGQKPHQCNICQERFLVSGSLKRHIRIHMGEKPYQCHVCQKRFSAAGTLGKHIRTHTGERAYQCSVCRKEFSRSDNLKIHVRSHTGEKPYQCKICGKTFSIRAVLRNHIRIHTGEKPFQCDVCLEKFSRSSSLKRHNRTHKG